MRVKKNDIVAKELCGRERFDNLYVKILQKEK